MQAASLLWDLRKFFECIPLAVHIFVARAVAAKIPMALTKLCLNVYRSLRLIRKGKRFVINKKNPRLKQRQG